MNTQEANREKSSYSNIITDKASEFYKLIKGSKRQRDSEEIFCRATAKKL